MWFMYDGVPFHFLSIVRHLLNQIFGEQLVGCEGLVSWSAQSPDLSLLDFYCGDT
jgi:hypothetical protein